MRISDWSSDVCSSDLEARITTEQRVGDNAHGGRGGLRGHVPNARALPAFRPRGGRAGEVGDERIDGRGCEARGDNSPLLAPEILVGAEQPSTNRSEEHTSELQSLMRISYAVFC